MTRLAILILCSFSAWTDAAHISPNHLGKGRIIGGTTAVAGQFPYAASIHKTTATGTYFCTGTLIKEQWILTSGQCVVDAVSFTIRLGSNTLNESDPNGQRFATDYHVLHPDFNPENLNNDVGLIRLRMPVVYNDYIKAVNLLSNNPLPDNANVRTLGWGQTSDSGAGTVDLLHFVDLTTLTTAECKLAYGSTITENMVCVEGNYNEGTCRGDLGSPLVQYHSDIFSTYLVGISTFISMNGCESPEPSGFTRIAPYVEWINGQTADNCPVF